MWFWSDGTPNYYNSHLDFPHIHLDNQCGFISVLDFKIRTVPCLGQYPRTWGLCAKPVSNDLKHDFKFGKVDTIKNKQINFSSSSSALASHYQKCDKGHYIHAYLKCNVESGCGTTEFLLRCPVGTLADLENIDNQIHVRL